MYDMHVRTALRLFLIILVAVVTLCSVAQADRIMIGLNSGEVYGRNEFDLATNISSSYTNFGTSMPVSALASGVQGDVAIGLNYIYGPNAIMRYYDNLGANITSVGTGNPITALTTRPNGDVVIGDGSNLVFVRDRTNLLVRPAGYTGTDGLNFNAPISALGRLASGDLVIANTNGEVFLRSGTNLANNAANASVSYYNYGVQIKAVAVLPSENIAIAFVNGVVDVRPLSNITTTLSTVNLGAQVNALAAISNGDLAIGLNNGQVQVRHSWDLANGLVSSATFGGGSAINALAATANDNVAIGTANNLVYVRRSYDLTLTPEGYSGTDGINLSSPVKALTAVPSGTPPTTGWRDTSKRMILRNDVLEARFQSGVLYQLTDRITGKNLILLDPATLPGTQLMFGSSSYNLDNATVWERVNSTTLAPYYTSSGNIWGFTWTMEPGSGDLVLHNTAITTSSVDEFRSIFYGLNISDYSFVWTDSNGVATQYQAPWSGLTIPYGDPLTGGSPQTLVQPLVLLFQGSTSGWFVEGREQNIGPACVMVAGMGQTIDVGMVRRSLPTTSPTMYDIRFRRYSGQWENAVDPYLTWMQNTVGFVALAQKSPAWVKDIKNQAYVAVGDYDGLDALAAKVDPAKTFVGRQADYRIYGFDYGYPNYQLNSTAAAWIPYARQLGFHVGAHFNTFCIDKILYPNLITQFQPGLYQIGTDGQGNPIYDGPSDRLVYCSPAYEPWRDYLIAQMADAVNAGVDVIYLDQSMAPCGQFYVNGVCGIQGVMSLEQEIMQTYPNVTVETEQFNPMASRYAGFALGQMPQGHPLSGYIFSRFINVVPEGVMYSPTDTANMDAFDNWGFMLPGTDTSREPTWMQIAQAYETYNLVPDSRMTKNSNQLFGFQGANGVTAYLEKYSTYRGLVVYQPGYSAQWFGKRYFGITTWPGPGAVEDWLLYNGSTLIGFEPAQTYYFDPSVTLSSTRFHVTSVPADFALYSDSTRRIVSQEIGTDDSYFKITFSGNGSMGLYVPDEYDVYLNSQSVSVNRTTNTATVTVSASPTNPSVIRAFRRSERNLVGKCVYMPLENPVCYSDGVWSDASDGYYSGIGARGMIFGRLPAVGNIHIIGYYGINANSTTDFTGGDGVIKINGTEVSRVHPTSQTDYQMYAFDANVSAYAGQYVMLEFICEGQLHGYAYTQWVSPQITADSSVTNMLPMGFSSQNGWTSESVASIRASSQHYDYVAQNLINGSGVSTDGITHGNTGLFISGTLAASQANPRGGTVAGGHWVEFTFNRARPLGEMWIWNYNSKSDSYNYTVQGFKTVTIQYSTTGSTNPADWTTIFTGDIPIAYSISPDYKCLPSMKLDFGGANAKYVVITTAGTPNHNWSNGLYSDAGLSEVRFYANPGGADRVMVGNTSGEVFGRSEYDLTTHIPASYTNFGSTMPISALATGIQGDVAIGLNYIYGPNTLMRNYNNLGTDITTVNTGSPITALATRPNGSVVIGDGGNLVFVRDRTDFLALAPDYVGGTDGLNFYAAIRALAVLPNGDLAIGNANGEIFLVSGINLANPASGVTVSYMSFAVPITSLAITPTGYIVIGFNNGRLDVRPYANIATQTATVNYSSVVNALGALPNGNVAIGLSSGYVDIRYAPNLTLVCNYAFGTSQVKAIAITSNDNVAVGLANNLVYIRRGSDLSLKPIGYVGNDGLNFNAPITALASTSGN